MLSRHLYAVAFAFCSLGGGSFGAPGTGEESAPGISPTKASQPVPLPGDAWLPPPGGPSGYVKKPLFDAVLDTLKDQAGPQKPMVERRMAEAFKDVEALKRKKKKTEAEDTLRILRETLVRIAKDGGPTAFLVTHQDQEYAAWESAFSGSLEGARVPQIGVHVVRRGARWFLSKVYAGSSAAQAGLMSGDEWVETKGHPPHPVADVLATSPGEALTLTLRRHASGEVKTVSVPVVYLSSQEVLAKHMEMGHRIIQAKDHPVAYLPLPAAAHPRFRQLLVTLAQKYQTESAAMILDLRDGSLGPDATYFEPFLGREALYTKPLILLVDHTTGGGRERLTRLLQKTKRSVTVGTPTQGLTEALDLIDIVPGEAALLVTVPKSSPKEPSSKQEADAAPTTPDILEERTLAYAAGSDPQLTKALEASVREIEKLQK